MNLLELYNNVIKVMCAFIFKKSYWLKNAPVCRIAMNSDLNNTQKSGLNKSCISKAIVFFVGLVFSLNSWAQIYVIKPQHRLPEEIASVLNQQFSSTANISAYANQLIINTTPQNMQAIQALINQLDTATQQLLLTVRLKDQRQQNNTGVQTDAKYCKDNICVANSPNVRREGAQVVIDNSKNTSTSNARQQVRALEGRSAYISIGQSVPVDQTYYRNNGIYGRQVYTTREYRNVDQGFNVTPRLLGANKVLLNISLSNDSVAGSNNSTGGIIVSNSLGSNDNQHNHRHTNSNRGSINRGSSSRNPQTTINTQRLVTNIEGPLNQWISLGAQDKDDTDDSSGVLSFQRGSFQQLAEYEIYVEKVAVNAGQER